jgi:glucokinase
MTEHVLAGDIGGTKTALALYAVARPEEPATRSRYTLAPATPPEGDVAPRQLTPLREASFESSHYAGLEEVLRAFLATGSELVAAAAFGIAGPVVDDAVTTTNLPWRIEGAALARMLGFANRYRSSSRLRLMNDLEATALGALSLPPGDVLTLNGGTARSGNRVVIAAGTGLGQAILFWDGARHRPIATEGGHVEFAPRDDREAALLAFLHRTFTHASYERVVSGPGLANIFRFLDEDLRRPVAPAVRARMEHEDAGTVIGEAGVAGSCPACAEAVEIFLAAYGAQAGNLALTAMATGGVYVGGGIVTKLLPKITAGSFLRSFTAKGRYTRLMTEIPVHVILNPRTALLGAAQAARALLG